MSTDLWPDISVANKPRGMKQILREVGSSLANKTDGLIRFGVFARADKDGQEFTFDGVISVPSVSYSYPLVRVTTGTAPFPADVVADGGVEVKGVANEEELKKVLAGVFRSERVTQLLNNLLAVAGD